MPGPDGTVFLPELGSYVDADVAESLLDAELGDGEDGYSHEEMADTEVSDEELNDLRDQLKERQERAAQTASQSETLDTLAHEFAPGVLEAGIEHLSTAEDAPDEILETLTELSGLDREATATLMETVVIEASPEAEAQVGHERWSALVYAASTTDDPFARRVVSEFARGTLPAKQLSKAYALWWNSLPDA